jgi:hypothetical protein
VLVHGINWSEYDFTTPHDKLVLQSSGLNKRGETHSLNPKRQPDKRSSRGRARRAPRPFKKEEQAIKTA